MRRRERFMGETAVRSHPCPGVERAAYVVRTYVRTPGLGSYSPPTPVTTNGFVHIRPATSSTKYATRELGPLLAPFLFVDACPFPSRISLRAHTRAQPANILLDSGMNARLGDAGIARVLDAAEGNAAATQVQGTLNYMDPGYMRTGTLNDKSDIYR